MDTKRRHEPTDLSPELQQLLGSVSPELTDSPALAAFRTPAPALQMPAIAAASAVAERANERLMSLLESLVVLEAHSGGETAVDVLRWVSAAAEASDVEARSAITDADEAALRSVGSYVPEMPPLTHRGSFLGAAREASVLDGALSAAQAAKLLGRSAARIRQRVQDRTLYSVDTPSGMVFPAVQFSSTGELHGWSKVAPHFPADAHPVEVETLMTTPTPELLLQGEATSPRDWLLNGGDPQRVAAFVAGAFGPR